MSAAARVDRFVGAATAHERRTISIEILRKRGEIVRIPLTVADLQALLDRLRNTCPDCETCETCGAWLCESCGVGEPATRCEATPPVVHCDHPDCLDRHCAIAAGEDAAAEAYADSIGGQF